MENREANPEVAAAKAIVTIAHRFQTDKLGDPCIGHPCRVAARLDDAKHIAAASRHDVIEDCSITADDLAAAGISDEVMDGVVLLTHSQDNTDPARTARLEPDARKRLARKYAKALELLAR